MVARAPLSQARVIDAAVRVADSGGLGSVSMRNVGKELSVEAMSLYHHIANKEALLDELADWVFSQIELPDDGMGWRVGMELRARSARKVLAAHSWALGLIESRRNPGPAPVSYTHLGGTRLQHDEPARVERLSTLQLGHHAPPEDQHDCECELVA